MKRFLAVIILGTLLFSCDKEEKIEGFKIDGQITGASNLELFLKKRVDGEFLNIDSVTTDSTGKFIFEGKIENPEMCYIKINDQKYISLFIEDNLITLTANIDSLEGMKVEGSLSHEQFEKYQESSKYLTEKGKELEKEYYAAREADDTAKLNKVIKDFDLLNEEENTFNREYIRTNTSTVVTPYLAFITAYALSLDDLKEITASLDTTLNNTVYVKELNKRIEILESTEAGKPSIDFTQNDSEGNPISLSSFKGKYVLVDFWASWCGPCRRENPNVVKIFQKYNEKGFEIFGVSFDTKKELWLEAIEKDGLTWSHVSDLKGWGNAAGKVYGIRSIPHTMLIDSEGIIIAHNLTSEELEAKLEEIFAGK